MWFSTRVALVLFGSLSLVEQPRAQEDLGSLERRAQRLIQERSYSEAAEVLERLLAADTSRAEPYALRAIARSQLGDRAGAIQDATHAIELDPRDYRGFYERGFNRYLEGDRPAALADYDRAVALRPDLAGLHGERGDCLREMGELVAAVAAYDRAIELNPMWSAPYVGRGRALNALTDHVAARRDFRRVSQQAPEDPEIRWLLAYAEFWSGEDAAALASTAEFVRLQPAELRSWALGLRGFIAWDIGELTLAAELFSQAAPEEAQTAAEIAMSLGCVQLAAGNLEAAMSALEAAARSDDPTQAGRARMMQWCIDARGQGLDAADARLLERLGERLAELPPVERGLVALCRGDTTDASATDGLFPSQSCARSFLAAWRAECEGDDARAEREFRRCLNTGSFDSESWKTAAVLLRARAPGALSPALGLALDFVPDPTGPRAVVTGVLPGSAAELQGLRVGDELLELAGRPITTANWDVLEGRGRIGQPVQLTRRRDGALEVLRIRLGVLPEE